MHDFFEIYLLVGLLLATFVSICISACTYTPRGEPLAERFSWFMAGLAIFIAVTFAWLPALLWLASSICSGERL